MHTHTPGEIASAKAALPAPIRDFLDSSEFKKILFDIGHSFGLNLRGVADLTDTVAMTVLGLEPQNAFPSFVSGALTSLGAEQRRKLIAEVDRKIFTEIKNRIHGPEKEDPAL